MHRQSNDDQVRQRNGQATVDFAPDCLNILFERLYRSNMYLTAVRLGQARMAVTELQ